MGYSPEAAESDTTEQRNMHATFILDENSQQTRIRMEPSQRDKSGIYKNLTANIKQMLSLLKSRNRAKKYTFTSLVLLIHRLLFFTKLGAFSTPFT